MAQTEIFRICGQIQAAQNGDAWHGPNLEEILTGVNARQASAHPIPGAHSIWEIVLHIMSWRIYTLRKLAGDADFDPDKHEGLNFPEVPLATEANWEECQQNLCQSCEELIAALSAENDDLLEVTVPGRDFPFYKLLHGIVQHDLYHGGQLILLKKFPV